MTTHRKEEIYQRALEMFHADQWKNGIRNGTNPTLAELKESGFVSLAISELMRDSYKGEIQARDYVSEIPKPFTVDIDEAMRTGVFTSGSSGSGKTILNFHLASILMENGITVYVIDPSQEWRKSNVPNRISVYKDSHVQWQDGDARCSTVFDVSMLNFKDRIKAANKTCHALLNARKQSSNDPPTLVVFEEAHLYFYQGSMRSTRQNYAVELVTTGRNYNLRFSAITQFPSMIDKLLVKMTRQRYFGWTSEPNDVEYIKNIIGPRMSEKLPLLEVGEFVYSYPTREHNASLVTVPLFQAKPMLVKT